MYLPNPCRIITIGDGDLSFSRALLGYVSPENLIATTYDSDSELREKYAKNALEDLLDAGVKVCHELDITSINSTQKLANQWADIVIFNHPLVPTQRSFTQYQKERNKTANLMNRALLDSFLKNSFEYLLAFEGPRLCYITTKSVKPYSHWHLETSLTRNTSYRYLGKQAFEQKLFKNYMIRNVDRDKCVKHQNSDIYCYSDKPNPTLEAQLTSFEFNKDMHCPLCRKGPFTKDEDWQIHQQTRIHKAQVAYHQSWLDYLS